MLLVLEAAIVRKYLKPAAARVPDMPFRFFLGAAPVEVRASVCVLCLMLV